MAHLEALCLSAQAQEFIPTVPLTRSGSAPFIGGLLPTIKEETTFKTPDFKPKKAPTIPCNNDYDEGDDVITLLGGDRELVAATISSFNSSKTTTVALTTTSIKDEHKHRQRHAHGNDDDDDEDCSEEQKRKGASATKRKRKADGGSDGIGQKQQQHSDAIGSVTPKAASKLAATAECYYPSAGSRHLCSPMQSPKSRASKSSMQSRTPLNSLKTAVTPASQFSPLKKSKIDFDQMMASFQELLACQSATDAMNTAPPVADPCVFGIDKSMATPRVLGSITDLLSGDSPPETVGSGFSKNEPRGDGKDATKVQIGTTMATTMTSSLDTSQVASWMSSLPCPSTVPFGGDASMGLPASMCASQALLLPTPSSDPLTTGFVSTTPGSYQSDSSMYWGSAGYLTPTTALTPTAGYYDTGAYGVGACDFSAPTCSGWFGVTPPTPPVSRGNSPFGSSYGGVVSAMSPQTPCTTPRTAPRTPKTPYKTPTTTSKTKAEVMKKTPTRRGASPLPTHKAETDKVTGVLEQALSTLTLAVLPKSVSQCARTVFYFPETLEAAAKVVELYALNRERSRKHPLHVTVAFAVALSKQWPSFKNDEDGSYRSLSSALALRCRQRIATIHRLHCEKLVKSMLDTCNGVGGKCMTASVPPTSKASRLQRLWFKDMCSCHVLLLELHFKGCAQVTTKMVESSLTSLLDLDACVEAAKNKTHLCIAATNGSGSLAPVIGCFEDSLSSLRNCEWLLSVLDSVLRRCGHVLEMRNPAIVKSMFDKLKALLRPPSHRTQLSSATAAMTKELIDLRRNGWKKTVSVLAMESASSNELKGRKRKKRRKLSPLADSPIVRNATRSPRISDRTPKLTLSQRRSNHSPSFRSVARKSVVFRRKVVKSPTIKSVAAAGSSMPTNTESSKCATTPPTSGCGAMSPLKSYASMVKRGTESPLPSLTQTPRCSPSPCLSSTVSVSQSPPCMGGSPPPPPGSYASVLRKASASAITVAGVLPSRVAVQTLRRFKCHTAASDMEEDGSSIVSATTSAALSSASFTALSSLLSLGSTDSTSRQSSVGSFFDDNENGTEEVEVIETSNDCESAQSGGDFCDAALYSRLCSDVWSEEGAWEKHPLNDCCQRMAEKPMLRQSFVCEAVSFCLRTRDYAQVSDCFKRLSDSEAQCLQRSDLRCGLSLVCNSCLDAYCLTDSSLTVFTAEMLAHWVCDLQLLSVSEAVSSLSSASPTVARNVMFTLMEKLRSGSRTQRQALSDFLKQLPESLPQTLRDESTLTRLSSFGRK